MSVRSRFAVLVLLSLGALALATPGQEDEASPGGLRARLRQRFDADSDGWLDPSERETMRQSHLESAGSFDRFRGFGGFRRGRERGGFRRGGGFRGFGRSSRPSELTAFDLDGDDRLSAEELAAVRSAREKGEPPPEREETPRPRPVPRPSPDASEPRGESPDAREPSKPVKFSHERGFHGEPFELALRTRTEGATIRYTLDGSSPTARHGRVYRDPIPVNRTAVVRARAFREGLRPGRICTRTFIFLDDVVEQSADGLPPAGAYYRWGSNTVDYGMDPRVVGDPRYRDSIRGDLCSIPTLSLVVDPADLFDEERGIYANAGLRGREAERAGSVELIHAAAGLTGFQEDCGVRIRGGFSRMPSNPKHAFRLFFRREYGSGKLSYPFFGDDAATEFDHVDLRCSQNYSWNMGRDPRGLFVRDQFNRDTQLALGQPAARGDYYHLYLNGQYWGLYNSCERPEASFGASYFGGDKEDYDVVKAGGTENGERRRDVFATDGKLEAWTRLYELAREDLSRDAAYQRLLGRNADGSRNPDLEVLLDPSNLIDYMLVILYGGNLDSPISRFMGNRSHNNWYGIRNRKGEEGFRFFIWDAEHTLLDVEEDRTGPFSAGEEFETSNPQWLWQRCLDSAEFRLLVADHVHRHFSPGGALAAGACRERFLRRTKQIEGAVVAESARWGDSRGRMFGRGGDSDRPLTRDDDWRLEVDRVLNEYIPLRSRIVVDQLFEEGLLPDLEPPRFTREGEGLVLVASRGAVYYTVDGSDPRRVGGALSESAKRYGEPVKVESGTVVKARARYEDEWSALGSAEKGGRSLFRHRRTHEGGDRW